MHALPARARSSSQARNYLDYMTGARGLSGRSPSVARRQRSARRRARRRRETVLVVDDEKNIRRTLQLVLEGEGYQVLGAETAEQALAILASPETPVDLAIFDVKLPDMSGLEALERRSASDEATRDTADHRHQRARDA